MHILFIALYYRVLGFTGIVRTDCNQTTKLLTHDDLEWPIYINPISLFIIFLMSTNELRLYLKSKVWYLKHTVNFIYSLQSRKLTTRSYHRKHCRQENGICQLTNGDVPVSLRISWCCVILKFSLWYRMIFQFLFDINDFNILLIRIAQDG